MVYRPAQYRIPNYRDAIYKRCSLANISTISAGVTTMGVFGKCLVLPVHCGTESCFLKTERRVKKIVEMNVLRYEEKSYLCMQSDKM